MSEPPLGCALSEAGRIDAGRRRLPGQQRPTLRVSGAQDVVDFERLVDLAEPFGAVGCAAAAALVERKLQLPQQACDFLARRHMAHARAGPERRLVEVVERGEPAGKELAV